MFDQERIDEINDGLIEGEDLDLEEETFLRENPEPELEENDLVLAHERGANPNNY